MTKPSRAEQRLLDVLTLGKMTTHRELCRLYTAAVQREGRSYRCMPWESLKHLCQKGFLIEAEGRGQRGVIKVKEYAPWKEGQISVEERVEKFLNEIVAISRKYGISISHEDGHGAFQIEKYDDHNIEWLRDARIYLWEDK